MKYTIILVLIALLFNCNQKTQDSVDYYDRFDLANTIDTTKGTYNPKVDSTYIFPSDSSDIVKITDTLGYKIKTIIFPVRNKYIVAFHESAIRREKVKYRDYKLQAEITNHNGLYLKKVISKYEIPDSIVGQSLNYYFIREAKFNKFENDEFEFDLKMICYGDDGCFPPNVKYYIHIAHGIRFETYADYNIFSDSTFQDLNWDLQ